MHHLSQHTSPRQRSRFSRSIPSSSLCLPIPAVRVRPRRSQHPPAAQLRPSVVCSNPASWSPAPPVPHLSASAWPVLGLRPALRRLPADNSCAQQLHSPSALLATLTSAATALPGTLPLTSAHLPVPSRERPSALAIPTTLELPTSQPQQRAQNAARTRDAQLGTTATAESTLQRHRHA